MQVVSSTPTCDDGKVGQIERIRCPFPSLLSSFPALKCSSCSCMVGWSSTHTKKTRHRSKSVPPMPRSLVANDVRLNPRCLRHQKSKLRVSRCPVRVSPGRSLVSARILSVREPSFGARHHRDGLERYRRGRTRGARRMPWHRILRRRSVSNRSFAFQEKFPEHSRRLLLRLRGFTCPKHATLEHSPPLRRPRQSISISIYTLSSPESCISTHQAATHSLCTLLCSSLPSCYGP